MIYRRRLADHCGAGPTQRAWWATMLLLWASVLMLAQTQGLMHRVVHVGQHELVSPRDHADHSDGEETHWVLRLFAAHEDSGTQCRLFDQSGHSATMPTLPTAGLPLLASPRHVACHEALQPSPAKALTLARGPPPFR